MGFSLGIIFGVLSMIGYGLDNALAKPLVKSMGPIRAIFFRNVLITLFLALSCFVASPSMPSSTPFMLSAFFLGLLGYLPVLAFFMALRVGKVGVVSPVSSLSVAFAVILSVMFLHETLGAAQTGAIIAIIAGVALISLNPKDWKGVFFGKAAPGVKWALVAGILWGAGYFLLKYPISEIGGFYTAALMEAGILLASGAHLAFSKEGFGFPAKGTLRLLFLVALTGAAGTLFFSLGAQAAQMSVVAALSMSFPFVAALYGHFAYRERLSRLQWLSVGLIVAGIAALQLA